jgi:hypothetical protein
MGVAIQMADFSPSGRLTKKDILEIRTRMDALAKRIRALSLASASVKDPVDQQQVALYIQELHQQLQGLNKQLQTLSKKS